MTKTVNTTDLRAAVEAARAAIAKQTKTVSEDVIVATDGPVELPSVEDAMRFLKGSSS